MIWFTKKHPNAQYVDIRNTIVDITHGKTKGRKHFHIHPDQVADFRNLPFPDGSFKLVVWDPPHLDNLQETSIFAKKYGSLNRETWRYDLERGFDECWRVLADFGVLIFKWSEDRIKLKKVLICFKQKPLFGHTTGSKSHTHWLCFMKIPEGTR